MMSHDDWVAFFDHEAKVYRRLSWFFMALMIGLVVFAAVALIVWA